MASNPLQKMVQQQAYAIVYWQLAGVALLASVTMLVFSFKDGLALFAGGLAYCLPNLLFVWRGGR